MILDSMVENREGLMFSSRQDVVLIPDSALVVLMMFSSPNKGFYIFKSVVT